MFKQPPNHHDPPRVAALATIQQSARGCRTTHRSRSNHDAPSSYLSGKAASSNLQAKGYTGFHSVFARPPVIRIRRPSPSSRRSVARILEATGKKNDTSPSPNRSGSSEIPHKYLSDKGSLSAISRVSLQVPSVNIRHNDEDVEHEAQGIAQVWFPGQHGDVGGGSSTPTTNGHSATSLSYGW
ncbi:uncharacterized protein N7459_006880 [Penicillium hispanicum]|uniref:uncharacterized protein n=1 Tax=Penicillium hispanicum TaxID=1080232 RepID=UPI0025411FD0|nr:uncharacterized protein N7459_006880 [Penicillium hispanicum]KAJ5577916.1 hypothetical protein N7459_006880 [Penicillium hispanicum]